MLAIPLRDETLQGNPNIKLNTIKIPELNITLLCSFVSGIKCNIRDDYGGCIRFPGLTRQIFFVTRVSRQISYLVTCGSDE